MGGGETEKAIPLKKRDSQKHGTHLATISAVCSLCVCVCVHERNIEGRQSGVKLLPTSFGMASTQGEISLYNLQTLNN